MGACLAPPEKPARPQRPNRARPSNLAYLLRGACVYSRCVFVEVAEAALAGATSVSSVTTGSRRSFHSQVLTAVAVAVAVVPLPPAVKRKADGCGCSLPPSVP